LPTADDAGQEAFGGWIEVEDSTGSVVALGELIAVHADTVYVLNDSLVAVARDSISAAALFGYDAQWDKLALWTTLGGLSTLSHGFGLVLSLPVGWLLGGTSAVSSRARQPRLQYPEDGWVALSQYARFPAGLPPSLPRALLSHATRRE
jgi:hypothetical protein